MIDGYMITTRSQFRKLSLFTRITLYTGIACSSVSWIHGDEADSADDDELEPVQFYRSPEERREAGLGTKLTDWLTFYGLLEGEIEYAKDKYLDRSTFSQDEDTEAIQIGLEADFNEWLFGEFVLEIENDRKIRTLVDEGVLALEFDTWAIKGGIMNLDFGEYYSHLVTGPLLEFGETRKWTLAFEQELNNSTDVVVYSFEKESVLANEDIGWGASFEWVSEDEAIRVGGGYLSDVRESDDFYREEDYATANDVSAWNMYAMAGFESFEVTAEIVESIDHFLVEEERFRPRSYNLELAYFVTENLQIAGRVEHAKDLVEEPEWQTGVGITWLAMEHLLISVDYLHGDFESPLEIEEDEEYLKNRKIFAAQVAIEF